MLATKQCRMGDLDNMVDELRGAASTFLRLHVAVHGTSEVKPKHHWLLDIPDQISRDRLVLDAFVIERQHLLVKKVAENVTNTRAFERSVLASLLTVQRQEVRAALFGEGLLGKRSRLQGAPAGVEVTLKMKVNCSVELTVGDIVRRGNEAGLVRACAADASGLFVYVSRMEVVANVTPQSIRCAILPELAIWRAAACEACLAWRFESEVIVVVLLR